MKFDKQHLTKTLYEIASASSHTLKDKRAIASLFVYAAPVAYRFITKNPHLPLFPEISTNYALVPPNLPEKLVINPAFPGYAGIVLRENYNKVIGQESKSFKNKVRGAFEGWAVWTALQALGYLFANPVGPHGQQIWEPLTVYSANLTIALLVSPLLSYGVDYASQKLSHSSKN